VFMWPMALTVSAMLGYRMFGLTGPDHDVLNVCLALMLAVVASCVVLIAQRRALFAALTASASIT